jgi:hypothetical protein
VRLMSFGGKVDALAFYRHNNRTRLFQQGVCDILPHDLAICEGLLE